MAGITPDDPTRKKPELWNTGELIVSAQQGHDPARDELYRRYSSRLTAWAHGRLPRGARSLMETQDLVQIALERSFLHLKGFESRFDGAFGAFLRRIVDNLVRDEVRKIQRRPVAVELVDQFAAPGASPLEEAIGAELLDRYEKALNRLTPEQSAAVALRVELGLSYAAIAEELRLPSDRAAYMRVSRGLRRLAEEMGEGRPAE